MSGDGKYREKPNIQFIADIVYTNTASSGAYRGYGVPQGFWPVERQMERIARALDLDPIEFRLKNALRAGELQPFSTAWSEGREPSPEMIETNGLEECVRQGRAAIGWEQKYGNADWQEVPGKPHLRRGVGVAMVMQGTAIPYLDMGGASIKLNDDGSYQSAGRGDRPGDRLGYRAGPDGCRGVGCARWTISWCTRRIPISPPSIRALMLPARPIFPAGRWYGPRRLWPNR